MKNQTAIILLFIANTISGFSQGVSLIAIPWHFVDVVDKPELIAYIYFFATFVCLFWGPYAGTLVDKYSRKNIFLLANVCGAVLFLSGGFSSLLMGYAPVATLAVLFSATFLIFNIHYPTLYAFAQELVEPQFYGKITSYIEVQGQTTSMIAGALAAILLKGGIYDLGFCSINVPKWEIYHVLLFDGCTYFVSVLIISLIAYKSTVKRETESSGVVERFRFGLSFLRQNPMVFLFGITSFTVFATVLVSNFVVSPNYVKNFLNADADVYAMHEISYAFGAIAAGLFINRIFKNYNAILGSIVLHVLCGLVYFIFAIIWDIPTFLSLMFFIGLANAGTRVLRITFLLERIPNQVIGRTGSIFMVINVLERLALIALFSLPFFIENIAWTYVICGICCFLAVVVLVLYYKKISIIQKLNVPKAA